MSTRLNPELIYLDENAASVPFKDLKRDLAEFVLKYDWVNPKSTHAQGQKTRRYIQSAKLKLLEQLKLSPSEFGVIFCASGTQAIQLSVKEALCWSEVELEIPASNHKASVEMGSWLDSHPSNKTQSKRQSGVYLQLVNNETGIISHIHNRDKKFWVDAIGAWGKIPLDISERQLQSLVLNPYKLGGVMAGGVWVYRKSVYPLHVTEHEFSFPIFNAFNIHWICDHFEQIKSAYSAVQSKQDRFESLLCQIPGVSITGAVEKRVPTVTHLMIDPAISGKNRNWVGEFDMRGICISQGSACRSSNAEPSHVLLAMDYSPEQAKNAIRVSYGTETRIEDLEFFSNELKAILAVG